MTKALRDNISHNKQNQLCYSKIHEVDRPLFCKFVTFLSRFLFYRKKKGLRKNIINKKKSTSQSGYQTISHKHF